MPAIFVAACVETGAPPAWFTRARVLGPLASFEACDRWVERPHREGVALIGDAAAATDPTFGDGLSLTLRDVRTLRDQLLATSDWGAAAEAYAEEHVRYYGALRRIQGWTRELLYERGPAAEARRARALPLLAREPDRRLDYGTWGPDGPSDEAARRRFYGEDAL
jgi:2-polyprenyl-6-methoxyphenol hydroxylase-like FAD-dependent oxidoreductase